MNVCCNTVPSYDIKSHVVWKQITDFEEKIKIENIKRSIKSKATPYRANARYCDTYLAEKTWVSWGQ